MPDSDGDKRPAADASRLLDAYREPVLQVDPDGRVTYVNAAARMSLGLAPGDALGDRLDSPSRADLGDLLATYTRDQAFPEDNRAWVWVDPEGSPLRTRVSVANLWDAGRVVGFVAAAHRDVMRMSDLWWQTLVEAAPGHILLLDREYRILFLNREAGSEELVPAVGRSTFEYIPPESQSRVRRYLDRAAAGEAVTYEVQAVDRGGRPTWYHTRAAPLPPECRPAVVILFATDITARRRDEEFARAVVEHAPVGIRVFDPAGNEIRLNEAMRRMLDGEARTDNTSYNLPGDPVARASGDVDRFRRALAGEVVVDRAEPPQLGGDDGGACHGLADRVFYPVPDGLGSVQAVVVFCVDVTEQRHVERKLQEAQKLESLGVLAGGLAHDLNNLMTPIVGHTELALAAASRTEVIDHLRQVVRAAEQSADLCRQLLDYAGRGRVVVGPVNLSDLVRRGEALLRHAAGPRVELRLVLDERLPGVQADAGQLRQVLLNLVTNAAEAIGESPGAVEVVTGVGRLGQAELARCRVGANRPPGEYVQLEVRDTGPGMPAEVLARAFDPFFTTKFTGRGLGLAAVLGIVQGHSGALAVDTTPGRGTAFRLYLPAAAGEVAARPGTDVHAALPSWGGVVLLADDEDAVRASVGAMLEGLGFEVDAVADGRNAVERVQSGRRYRLAVLDVTMREVGGAEALAAIRRVKPDLPVVLMSGYAADEVGERVGKAGGRVSILQKPFRLAELSDVVGAALSGA